MRNKKARSAFKGASGFAEKMIRYVMRVGRR
jgi:hypothetical protein